MDLSQKTSLELQLKCLQACFGKSVRGTLKIQPVSICGTNQSKISVDFIQKEYCITGNHVCRRFLGNSPLNSISEYVYKTLSEKLFHEQYPKICFKNIIRNHACRVLGLSENMSVESYRKSCFMNNIRKPV